MTGINRGISQLQISHHQKNPPKSDCSHSKNSPAYSLRFCRIWMLFLRTVRLYLTLLEVFTQKQHVSFKMAQIPPCSGIRRSISCLFWNTTTAKLCWLFRAILRNLIPRNLILGIFIRVALILMNEFWIGIWDRPETHRCIECPLLFIQWLDSWVVNPGVMPWYLDCYEGRKNYRVEALTCELEFSLWGPTFPDFN